MFTGIIEFTGEIQEVIPSGTNVDFVIRTPFNEPIRVDQSVAHDGVCLTVTQIDEQGAADYLYRVTAVQETLEKTNLGIWQKGRRVNIERCLRVGDRLDGHFVQGHVDTTGTVLTIEAREGSWMFTIGFDPIHKSLLVNKGSVCINGVSLTVVESTDDHFTVTIIPYTFEHTGFSDFQVGDKVNLEFDVLGKYILKHLNGRV